MSIGVADNYSLLRRGPKGSIYISLHNMKIRLNSSQWIDNLVLSSVTFADTMYPSKKGMFVSVSTLCPFTGVSQTRSLWRIRVHNVSLVHEKSETLGKSIDIV